MSSNNADSLLIRAANLGDLNELCDLYLGQSPPIRRLFHPFPYDRRKLKLILAAVILSSKMINFIKRIIPKLGFVIFVALDVSKPQLVGFIYFHITAKEGGKYIANVGITTKEGVQIKGIGTKLYAALIRRAQEVDVKKCWATILADNAPSIALCKKCGYQIIGPAADDVWEGKREKNILVELDLEKVYYNRAT